MYPLAKANDVEWPWEDKYVVYMQCFDICNKDSMSQLQILRHAKRMNGQCKGDVVPLGQLRAFVHLIPCYGASADPCLTSFNFFKHSSEFYHNKYFDKDPYLCLSSA